MQELAQWLIASETTQLAYSLLMAAVMILPMIWLSIWYHSNIGKTEGGKRLMAKQNSAEMRPRLGGGSSIFGAQRQATDAASNLKNAGSLHTGIMSGKFGAQAKSMQIQVYKFCAVWLGALAVLGAIPFVVHLLAG